MQQQDFRKLVQQRRVPVYRPKSPPVEEPTPKPNKSLKEKSLDYVKDFDRERKKEKRRAILREKQKEVMREKKALAAATEVKDKKEVPSIYRDRARERRKGEGDTEQVESLTAEQTMFLSGDKEYTGAVRGLDYVLLKRTREEMEKKKLEEETKVKEEAEKAEDEEAVEAEAPTTTQTASVPDESKTALGRSILRYVYPEPHSKSIDMFRPRHLVYQFKSVEIPDGTEIDDLPVLQFQSLADCAKFDERSNCIVPDEIFAVIEAAAARSAFTKRKKKRMKRQRTEEIEPEFEIAIDLKVNPLVLKPKITKSEENPEEEDESDPLKLPSKPIEVIEDIFPGVGRDYMSGIEELIEKKRRKTMVEEKEIIDELERRKEREREEKRRAEEHEVLVLEEEEDMDVV